LFLFGEVRLELPGISGSGAGQPVHKEEACGQLPVLRVRLAPITLCVAHLQIEKKGASRDERLWKFGLQCSD
jgi:hypothetical protein